MPTINFNDEYEKLRLLGQGAFAAIWKVRHRRYGYIRAVKVSNEVVESEEDKAYQTFLKECRVLLGIGNGSHPNIVHIYQPRLLDNRAVVEMDYVEGCTLEQYVARQRFVEMDEVMRFARQIVGALAYCHVDIYQFLMNPEEDRLQTDPNDARHYLISSEKREELIRKYRVTHNDLHSNNVMRRDYDGAFVLLDFGLSIQDGHSVKSSSRHDGAVEYKAPEKWEDGEPIPQTDVYGLGILLYQMLAGRVPFLYNQVAYSTDLQALNALYNDHKSTLPPAILPLRKAAFEAIHPGANYVQDYPEQLERIIRRCLAKDPQHRYPDAKALLADIDACMSPMQKISQAQVPPKPTPSPVPSRSMPQQPKQTSSHPEVWFAVIGGVLLLAALVIILLLLRRNQQSPSEDPPVEVVVGDVAKSDSDEELVIPAQTEYGPFDNAYELIEFISGYYHSIEDGSYSRYLDDTVMFFGKQMSRRTIVERTERLNRDKQGFDFDFDWSTLHTTPMPSGAVKANYSFDYYIHYLNRTDEYRIIAEMVISPYRKIQSFTDLKTVKVGSVPHDSVEEVAE